MHSYIFNTDLGTFEITNAHLSNHHHRSYELWLEDEKIGEYATAQDAAEDVAAFNTGCIEWDDLESEAVHVPAGIEGWTEVIDAETEELDSFNGRAIRENPFLVGEEG